MYIFGIPSTSATTLGKKTLAKCFNCILRELIPFPVESLLKSPKGNCRNIKSVCLNDFSFIIFAPWRIGACFVYSSAYRKQGKSCATSNLALQLCVCVGCVFWVAGYGDSGVIGIRQEFLAFLSFCFARNVILAVVVVVR